MCQSRDKGLDTLYCRKWRKISKSYRDLDRDQTMPNVELVRAIFHILQYVQVSSGLNLYYSCVFGKRNYRVLVRVSVCVCLCVCVCVCVCVFAR